jgi:L-fucose mutarotase
VLIGIHPLLSPDLLHALAAMGHGDEIAIVDANFPAASLGPRLVEIRGASSPDVLDAVLTLFPLDTSVVRRCSRWKSSTIRAPCPSR